MNECLEIVKHYLRWLDGQFEVANSGKNNGCIINTPFQDDTGKLIEIEVYNNNDHVIVSDRGETFDTLFLQGVNIHTKKRKKIIDGILKNYNAAVHEGEIWLETKFESLSAAMQNMLQVINSISYLTYTASPSTARSFKELVLGYFNENNVPVILDHPIMGVAIEHSFDFYYRKEVPLVFRAMSTSSPSYAKTLASLFAYSVMDIEKAGSRLGAHPFIDDRGEEESVWEGEPRIILNACSDEVVYWSKRERALEIIAA